MESRTPPCQTILKCARSVLSHWLINLANFLGCCSHITKSFRRNWVETSLSLSQSDAAHYIPHHPVQRNSATTLIRIAYDCSCRQSGDHSSLNNCLMSGPPFLVDLLTIVLHFWTHFYSLSTNIEKAFLCVILKEVDRDFTCFLNS